MHTLPSGPFLGRSATLGLRRENGGWVVADEHRSFLGSVFGERSGAPVATRSGSVALQDYA